MIGSGPDGVLRLAGGALDVDVWEDHTYTRASADNVHAYDRELAFAGGPRHEWRAMGVRVSQGGRAVSSAVVLLPNGGGDPGVHTVLARPGTLYLPCGGEVAALDLPALGVRWRTHSHLGCVNGLHEIPDEDALIVRGELTVARVEPDGRVAWERGGRDIFSGELRIVGGTVEVTDWNEDLYRFRLSDGEILEGPPAPGPGRGRPAPWAERLRAWLG